MIWTRENGLGLVALGVVSAVTVGPVYAVTLVSDTFDVPTGATRIDDLSDSLDTAWWNFGSGTISHIVDNGSPGIGNDNTLRLEGAAPKILGNFTDTSLASVGDWIELRFNLRDVSGVASGSIRFGLYNSNPNSQADSVVNADAQGSRTGNDVGYWVILEPSAGYMGTKDGASFGGGSTLDFATQGALSNIGHEIALRVTRENATQMRLTINYDGSDVVTGLDANINTDLFNEAAIYQTSGTDLILDDIRVTTNVPEPAAAGMFSVAVLLLARRNR